MLIRFFLTSVLLMPPASWAACTIQQVGALTFSDCPAEGHATNAAVGGVVLQPLSDVSVKSAPFKLVRSHETLDIGGHGSSTTAKTAEDRPAVSGLPATNKKTDSKATKKSAK